MANIQIAPFNQSSPNWKLPKGFEWNVRTEKMILRDENGFMIFGKHYVRTRIWGQRDAHGEAFGVFAVFDWYPSKDSPSKYYIDFYYSVEGITHDINVALDGGDARGQANILLDSLAEDISAETGVDPQMVNRMLQHQNVGEA